MDLCMSYVCFGDSQNRHVRYHCNGSRVTVRHSPLYFGESNSSVTLIANSVRDRNRTKLYIRIKDVFVDWVFI